MKLIPNTLFARSMILMIVMIILSIVAGSVLYVYFITRPSASSTADIFALHINSVHKALEVLEPDQRQPYLDELVNSGFLHVIRDGNARPGRPAEHGYEHIFLEYYPKLLFDEQAEIRFDYDDLLYSENPRIIWAKVNIDGKPIWLGSPMGKFKAPFVDNLLALLGVIFILTAIGAYIITRLVKRPLNQLVKAAKQLGSGNVPEPLEEAGTEEFRTVSRAFNRMAEDVQQLADDRNLMLAGISHDLRTPLARVRLALDMIEGKIDADRYAGMVQDIEDIDKIVGQFLTFVRDGVEEPFNYADLNELVKHVCSGYKHTGREVKQSLGRLPKVMFKSVAMQRLLMNLIDNAFQYGKHDVEIATSVNGESIILEVMDRGDGIPESKIDILKQPFTRLETSRSDTKGAGLGLAIVDRIVQWHQGDFTLQSREGGGLVVKVNLPIAP